MTEGVLLYRVEGGVATLTLNRPDKRNALNAELVQALKDALDRAEADESARVIVIAGAGRDFCSGLDLADLQQISDLSAEENLADARSLGALFTRMREHPLPIVAMVTGKALAGGCGLATACDVVLAQDDAQFGYPEVHLGFVPALVMAILRRKVSEGKAFDLVTAGGRIAAGEAERLGLVTQVFPSASFREGAAEYASALASKPPTAVAMTKRLLYDLDGLEFEEAIERGAQVNAEARMTAECREGVRRFLDKSG